MQTDILFPVHEIENNTESQKNLDENKIHFSAQCLNLYNWLINGNNITNYKAITEHGIAALPRRIKDLKNNGVKISDKWSDESSPKFKIYFMSDDDIKENRTIFC